MDNSLFQFQTELIETKVHMAAMNAIDRVVEQFRDIRNEIHDMRIEFNQRFSAIENRLVAVETTLGMVNQRQKEVREKFLDYAFKAGWMIFGAVTYYLILHIH